MAPGRWDNSLLPHYRTGIEQLYQNSVDQGFRQPVIVGFELAHEYAFNMAVEQFGKDTVESYAQSARTDEPAVLFAALSQEQATQRLSQMQGFKRLDDQQTEGMFAVVFVRDGKSEWISVPIPGDSFPEA